MLRERFILDLRIHFKTVFQLMLYLLVQWEANADKWQA
jgi:hypothetical protein